MRTKTLKTVVTFSATADVLRMESTARQNDLPGRIIPVPSEISAGCGMAWCVEHDKADAVIDALSAFDIAYEGIHEVNLY